MCVLILVYLCPHTSIYVSSFTYQLTGDSWLGSCRPSSDASAAASCGSVAALSAVPSGRAAAEVFVRQAAVWLGRQQFSQAGIGLVAAAANAAGIGLVAALLLQLNAESAATAPASCCCSAAAALSALACCACPTRPQRFCKLL
jgi:hypothetical protein